ncbi:MAG: fructose-bisphosphate aldolase, partial [Synergistaceae bacterium]|nr:fructose-bisphosphate aldolase [Synergistaceae bacterium]
MSKVIDLLGDKAGKLLDHRCVVDKSALTLPGPDYLDRTWGQSDRPNRVLGSLHALYNTGNLAGTGYISILPVDQGIEHSAGASFAPNPMYFDPENIIKLALEA